MLTILLVVVVLMLLGSMPTWRHSRGWGYYPSGGLGLVFSNLTPAVFGYGGNVFVGNAGGTVSPGGVQTSGNLCETDAICP